MPAPYKYLSVVEQARKPVLKTYYSRLSGLLHKKYLSVVEQAGKPVLKKIQGVSQN